MRLVTGIAQRGFHDVAPGRMNITIGDDRNRPLAQASAAMLDQFREKAGGDPHFIGSTGNVDRDHSHFSMPLIIFAMVRLCGP